MTNIQLTNACKNIPNFRGVFMRTNLPRSVLHNESGIINLDNARGHGTHWVAYVKRGDYIQYFDSFGNLRPPLEVIQYFGEGSIINYNHINRTMRAIVVSYVLSLYGEQPYSNCMQKWQYQETSHRHHLL